MPRTRNQLYEDRHLDLDWTEDEEVYLMKYILRCQTYLHTAHQDVAEEVCRYAARELSNFYYHDFTYAMVVRKVNLLRKHFWVFHHYKRIPGVQYCRRTNVVTVSAQYWARDEYVGAAEEPPYEVLQINDVGQNAEDVHNEYDNVDEEASEPEVIDPEPPEHSV
ncbi:hypothetical protein DH2020_049107 [Rehmannia glutinosa]|uniref:Uncharacterized protein n=1 Tax=Rehmannia glutinosa TaxID=99300 RepID=A0ABR0U3S3_REHGL